MGGILFYTCLRGRAGDGAAMREVAAAVWGECSPAVGDREARGEKEERWLPLAAVQGAREAGKGWLGVRRRSLPPAIPPEAAYRLWRYLFTPFSVALERSPRIGRPFPSPLSLRWAAAGRSARPCSPLCAGEGALGRLRREGDGRLVWRGVPAGIGGGRLDGRLFKK